MDLSGFFVLGLTNLNHLVVWTGLVSGDWEQTASKLIEVHARMQFLVAGVLRSLSPVGC